MSIKLLQITPAYKPAFVYGGPTMSVAKLCEALAENKVDITVLTTTANGKTELPVKTGQTTFIDGVPVVYSNRITKDHTHFSPALLIKLRSILKRSKNRKTNTQVIVHIHAWWNLVSILTCQLAKWLNVPVVLSPRGMLTRYTLGNKNSGSKAIINTLMGQKLLRYCHIHATSEKEKNDILQFITPQSITVIPNLVDFPKELHIEAAISSIEFKLLFLSRVEEKKGIELLMEALADLEIDWKLTIAGSGESKYITSLQQLSEKLMIENRINWIGHVSNENKFQLLAANDLLVLTSYNENFANVVIESLRVGTGVLLSNEVGLASYVIENDFGWITPLEKEAITKALEEAHKAVKKREVIRNTAPKKIEEDFKTSNIIHQYISLYKRILNV
jgi:glycosyltransferase involved in cell wall biosynthesis